MIRDPDPHSFVINPMHENFVQLKSKKIRHQEDIKLNNHITNLKIESEYFYNS